MSFVGTPDGYGEILRTQSAHGRTSYLVKGAGFEGWYDGLEVTADFADQPDDVIPNDDNSTALPYPSAPQGPGWDGTTSTIQPNIDPHLEMGHASDSLTGDSTDEDPTGADLDGDFEPHSRLSSMRAHRLHFATSEDPILDNSALPEESPTGLDNSPINPDGVSTDDLFDHENGFERAASYDRLTINDDLSFMRFAADDDKKHQREQDDDGRGTPFDTSDDDDDDDSSNSDSDGGSDGGDGGGHTAAFREALTTTADLHFLANLCVCAEELPLHSKQEHRELLAEGGLKNRRKKNQPMGDKPLKGKHEPEHGPKSAAEAGYGKGAGAVDDLIRPKTKGRKPFKGTEKSRKHADGNTNGVTPQEADWDELYDRYTQDHFTSQESYLRELGAQDNEDGADLYNKYASTKTAEEGGSDKYIGSNGDGTYHLIASGNGKLPKGQQYGHYDSLEAARHALRAIEERNHALHISKTAAPAQPPQPTQIESQIEQLMQFWAVDNNGWWHWTGSQSDLALLNQMQQQMMAVGMPQGQPGAMQTQSAFDIEAGTPEPWREYFQTIASDKLVALAAWRDVVDKSKRLRAEGAIQVEAFRPDVITAYIQGDNGRYYTTVQRLGSVPGAKKQLTSTQVSGWSCDCEWGHWAFLRKRSFVGRMCSHAYALFSEMRSLDAKARRTKGQPGRFASIKTSWINDGAQFVWVTQNPAAPTASIARTASGWNAQIWSDGTAEDSLDLGNFRHSKYAMRAVARVVNAHVKLAEQGDVEMAGDDNVDEYEPEPLPGEDDDARYDEGPGPGIQESKTSALSVFAEHDDGQDDEGPEEEDSGVEEEEDPRDDESLDEEIAEDEDDDSDDGQDDEGDEPEPEDDEVDDGGHDEPHKRDDSDDDGTDNPGDESDDDHVEKQSSVAELQQQFGLSHLAGANYSLAEQAKLVGEGEGKMARNSGDLNLAGTHYEANKTGSDQSPEDTLAFLF